MSTLLLTHSHCLEHDPGLHHPESADRLRAVLHALDAERFSALIREDAPSVEIGQIARVHPLPYAEALLAALPDKGSRAIDGDTIVSPGSKEAALRAAGAVVRAVDAVFNNEAVNAFCAVRPPGHHAEPTQAMGFCLLNSVAIAAKHAQAIYRIKRVAIIDFDVHHGNGTQTVAEADPELFYGSSHQFPFYPGTGAASERGQGNIANVPLTAGSGSKLFRDAYRNVILPALDAFAPELLLISAGFDAHAEDPLAQIEIDEDDFAWITAELLSAADRHSNGRVVSVLEGGYNLAALGRSAAVHVAGLMGA